jgi:hypothetical protein
MYVTQLRVFSRADANGQAHLFRVKVLIDNAINELVGSGAILGLNNKATLLLIYLLFLNST